MKSLLANLLAVFLSNQMCVGQEIKDPARIEVYVTPYYNSNGPAIDIGPFSKGLGTSSESEFLEAIAKMRTSWDTLKFTEMYVAAIRLYDRGFRRESIYWFYSAQYRGRLFGTLLDQRKMGGIGESGFELSRAANAFHQLVGPYINGYAFGDIEHLIPVIERVRKESKAIPDLNKIYPGVAFKKKSEWEAGNREINEGLSKLLVMLKDQKAVIKQQRIESGVEARFSKLTNKELTKGASQ